MDMETKSMIKSVPKSRLALPGALAAILVLVAAALGAAPALAAGGYGSSGGTAAATSAPAAASVQVGTTSTPALGTVLTGPNGMTLYTLSSDPTNGSVCTGKCLTAWPPLLVAAGGTVTGPSGSSIAFASFTRADNGADQVTADGRALYYFAQDTAPGQVNGDGIKALGGVWHVAGLTAAPAASATPAANAGGAYGGLPAASAAPGSATQPASSGTNMSIWPVILVLAIVVVAVALVAGIRRRRTVGNR
jgi:predicted lipoprotein with Yx(FWY)xxD motif